jgi:hypothetical protein
MGVHTKPRNGTVREKMTYKLFVESLSRIIDISEELEHKPAEHTNLQEEGVQIPDVIGA